MKNDVTRRIYPFLFYIVRYIIVLGKNVTFSRN